MKKKQHEKFTNVRWGGAGDTENFTIPAHREQQLCGLQI